MSSNSTDNVVTTTEQRIAATLQESRQEILARLWVGIPSGGTEGESGDRGDAERVLHVLAQAFEHGRWGTYYCLFREPLAAARWLTWVAVALVPFLFRERDGAALVARLIEVVGEMTLVVSQAERADIDREADELRELVELKSAFLRLTTHELRRPLGLTRGHLALLQEGTYGDVPDLMRHPLQQIASGAHEMASLLDGLAAVARLEDRAEVLNPSPCRLGALVSDVIRAVEPDARMKGVYIDERLPQPDVQIIADTEKLRIAVLNLLTNAIKYAPSESTVSVEAAIGRGEVAIAVADQGPGIDPSDEDQVFEKYYRSSTLPESLPGLGLGLYIVRQIVELHGGRVTLESVPGRGSTFAIFLPTG